MRGERVDVICVKKAIPWGGLFCVSADAPPDILHASLCKLDNENSVVDGTQAAEGRWVSNAKITDCKMEFQS